MASIFAARPSQLNLFHRCPIFNCRSVTLKPTTDVKFRSDDFPVPSFRSKNTKGLQLRQRSCPISASDSSDSNSIKEEKDGNKATDGAQGPPFLTILAGFLVFSLICWMISSAVMSLIGIIVKLIPSK